MNKTFSIIVPIYKVEKYLNKCIESILSQTFTDYELILVDDGSPDNCPQICDDYKKTDERIKVIHKQNGGLSDARNFGLDIAKGRYVIFIDSDDYWCENNLLEKIYRRQRLFEEDIILIGCKIIKEDGTEEITRSNYDISLLNKHHKSSSLDYLFASNNFPGSAWIFSINRNLIESNHLRFKVGVTSEDFEWIISSLVACNAIGAIDGVHYAYIRRQGSITKSAKFSSIRGAINAIEKYYTLNQRYIALDKFLARIYLLSVMSYNQLSSEDKKKASPLLHEHTKILSRSNKYYYWFVKLLGLHISSYVICKVYHAIR